MLNNKLNIGYFPYSNNFDSPGDRRRFIFFAKENNIKFEKASFDKSYDIVYLNFACCINQWVLYKKKNPNVIIIFELIDSYLSEGFTFKRIFRGLIRFTFGNDNYLSINHLKSLINIISISDAVVCSTLKQKKLIEKYNSNVHISLDYFSQDIKYHFKKNYNNKKLKIVWEGQSNTINNLLLLNSVFKYFRDRIELFIVTDLTIKYSIPFISKSTKSLLNKLECNYTLIKWDIDTFSKYISECDLAIIPIFKNNQMMRNKPENKLLMFWEIGIPVLTSDTAAYKDVMVKADLQLFCNNQSDWIKKIDNFMFMPLDELNNIIIKSKNYLNKYHNKEIIINNWNKIFNSLNKNHL